MIYRKMPAHLLSSPTQCLVLVNPIERSALPQHAFIIVDSPVAGAAQPNVRHVWHARKPARSRFSNMPTTPPPACMRPYTRCMHVSFVRAGIASWMAGAEA